MGITVTQAPALTAIKTEIKPHQSGLSAEHNSESMTYPQVLWISLCRRRGINSQSAVWPRFHAKRRFRNQILMANTINSLQTHLKMPEAF
jgi:hypothetical protein